MPSPASSSTRPARSIPRASTTARPPSSTPSAWSPSARAEKPRSAHNPAPSRRPPRPTENEAPRSHHTQPHRSRHPPRSCSHPPALPLEAPMSPKSPFLIGLVDASRQHRIQSVALRFGLNQHLQFKEELQRSPTASASQSGPPDLRPRGCLWLSGRFWLRSTYAPRLGACNHFNQNIP